jgi:hypothetical protein
MRFEAFFKNKSKIASEITLRRTSKSTEQDLGKFTETNN